MKKFIIAAAAAGLTATGAFAGATANVDIANAYVYRGTTWNDDLVIQPGIELSGFGLNEKYGVIALGAWSSSAPFSDGYKKTHETDWYLNYALPKFSENLDLYVQFTEYQYTGLGEREFTFGAGYALGGFYLAASGNYMYDSDTGAENQLYIDLSGDYLLNVSEKMDVTFGALFSVITQGDGRDIFLDDGLNHFEIGAAADYALGEMWGLGVSLDYIGELNDQVLLNHDTSVIAKFSIGCEM